MIMIYIFTTRQRQRLFAKPIALDISKLLSLEANINCNYSVIFMMNMTTIVGKALLSNLMNSSNTCFIVLVGYYLILL